jgi:hypothetical protein
MIDQKELRDFLPGRDVNDFVFTVLDKYSDEILTWCIEDVLDEINKDRPEKWDDYTKDDWFEGWLSFCEDDIFTMIQIDDKGDIVGAPFPFI